MSTEHIAQRFQHIDILPIAEQLSLLHASQTQALHASWQALPAIQNAVVQSVGRIENADSNNASRLIYCGSGTSGRLAVLDAVELLPSFAWPPQRLVTLMAGGDPAMFRSQEGCEDDAVAAETLVRELMLKPADVLIGVAASGKTPFTVSALRKAKTMGALTIGIACNAHTPLLDEADCPIHLDTGAEAIAGSTRLAAGTSQKIALNLLSSAIMMQLGRVYHGRMVAMQLSNQKLSQRALKIIVDIAQVSQAIASDALAQSQRNLPQAILIALGLTQSEAKHLLNEHQGNVQASIQSLHTSPTLLQTQPTFEPHL